MSNAETIFGTPIYTHVWPSSDELNADLKRVILAKEESSSGESISNRGGWHSEMGLFSWGEPCVEALKDRVATIMREVIRDSEAARGRKFNFAMASWANVSRRGNYNGIHSHVGATWSGVYYVSSGEVDNDDPENGRLELIDPRVGLTAEAFITRRQLINPMPGLVIIFPSWLKHMVHPFSGTGERISIAFNVNVGFE